MATDELIKRQIKLIGCLESAPVSRTKLGQESQKEGSFTAAVNGTGGDRRRTNTRAVIKSVKFDQATEVTRVGMWFQRPVELLS